MNYRLATPTDWPEVTKIIASTGRYYATDAAKLDGVILLAELDEKIVGCIWAMYCGRHAYIDYLSVLPRYQRCGVGPRLMSRMQLLLRTVMGVQYVRWTLKEDHEEMVKLSRAFGAVSDPGYLFVHKNLGG